MSEAVLLRSAEPSSFAVDAADWALLGGALLLSALLVWLVAGEALAAAAYLGGAAVLAVPARALLRPRSQALAVEPPRADWSVTRAAIDRPDVAVAVADRAGRMVCANPLFEHWFGTASPPGLPFDGDAERRLADVAHAAWRDGSAETDDLIGGGQRWRAEARRCGRADDHLVWTIAPLEPDDVVAQAVEAIAGKAGRMLAFAGIQAAVVTADGRIVAANPEFVRRAVGDPEASVTDTEFVTHLRQDEQDRIVYMREGGRGSSLRLLEVPLVDPVSQRSAAASAPSLMLLVEAGAGVGEASTKVPQIEALLARLPLGLAMTNREGKLLFANEAFRRAAGHGDRVAPHYPSDLVIGQDKGVLTEAVRRHAQGLSTAGEVSVRLRSAPGEPVTLNLAGVRGLGEAAVLLSLKDSSEEARLKRQIAQATKMQAVGQLAGGVAHDFNNVLTAIIGFCDLMLLRHTPGDSDYDDIQQIKAASNRAAGLTRQLLAFSRQQTLRPQVLQLPDIVSEISHMLKRLLGEQISLEVSHARDLGPVRADPSQLEQVIVNLVVNARDAILAGKDKGGAANRRVTLRTFPVTAADVRRMNSDIMPIGDYTALVVEDTGTGIPLDIIGKIFEPFFTTKEMGKGTGLGLSTVYGIVKQSGGFIFADSEPDARGRRSGARFTVYLPVHEGDNPGTSVRAESRSAPGSTWAGGGRVLLVEDEDTVRAVAERALTRAGYDVTSARDGEDGLAAVADGAGFDLVVSDVVMPGKDGPAMAKAIRELRPDLPILFMSGYAEEQLRREIDLPDVHFLSKPFSVAEIGDAVERILSDARA